MGDVFELKEKLTQAMVTLNTGLFDQLLFPEGRPVPLSSVIDRHGYSLCHELAMCLVNEEKVLEFFAVLRIHFAAEAESLSLYLNCQTKEDKKTALQIAVQNNRPKLGKMFIECGADTKLEDVNGDNVLHVAAARGNLSLIVFFVRECGISINSRDKRGRTPLHIAALEGQELAASLLISWTEDLNIKDFEGLTALHLAAFSQTYRIARHLLMAGANRNEKDFKGSIPRELAEMRGATDISAILKDPSCLVSINPLRTPLQPPKNTFLMFVVYHFIFLLRYAFVFLFLIPVVWWVYGVVISGFCGITFVLFEVVSNVNPGYIEQKPNRDLSYLYEKYNGDYVCSYCEVKRPGHARHCQHCNRCVKRFDHHCPWIHNCVGLNNYKLFVFFIIVTVFDFLGSLALGLAVYLQVDTQQHTLYKRAFPKVVEEDAEYIGLGVAVFCVLSLILVIPLCYVQVTNLYHNTTTHERYANPGRRSEVAPQAQQERNSLLSDISDTNSMLLQHEEQWALFSGTTGSNSAPPLPRVVPVTRCCGFWIETQIPQPPQGSVIEGVPNARNSSA